MDDYTFSCGKYKGNTFESVYEGDKKYVNYILNLPVPSIIPKSNFYWFNKYMDNMRDEIEKTYNEEIDKKFIRREFGSVYIN